MFPTGAPSITKPKPALTRSEHEMGTAVEAARSLLKCGFPFAATKTAIKKFFVGVEAIPVSSAVLCDKPGPSLPHGTRPTSFASELAISDIETLCLRLSLKSLNNQMKLSWLKTALIW